MIRSQIRGTATYLTVAGLALLLLAPGCGSDVARPIATKEPPVSPRGMIYRASLGFYYGLCWPESEGVFIEEFPLQINFSLQSTRDLDSLSIRYKRDGVLEKTLWGKTVNSSTGYITYDVGFGWTTSLGAHTFDVDVDVLDAGSDTSFTCHLACEIRRGDARAGIVNISPAREGGAVDTVVVGTQVHYDCMALCRGRFEAWTVLTVDGDTLVSSPALSDMCNHINSFVGDWTPALPGEHVFRNHTWAIDYPDFDTSNDVYELRVYAKAYGPLAAR